MTVPIYQVDAFAEDPFAGNPAAVCLLPGERPDSWMQQVAAEMNLSETAFLAERSDGWQLRWFTPVREVDLCGHATLASAHVLWEEGFLDAERQACFHTRSGLLTARHGRQGIEMDFPTQRPEPVARLPGPVRCAAGVAPVSAASCPTGYLLELDSETAVRGVAPDFPLLRDSDHCLLVTSRSEDPTRDFVSRYFAPPMGIDEDPVTGAAHCSLGPYWQERLGKSEFVAWQASTRGGLVRVRVEGERTVLGGRAVTVFRGELVGGAAG